MTQVEIRHDKWRQRKKAHAIKEHRRLPQVKNRSTKPSSYRADDGSGSDFRLFPTTIPCSLTTTTRGMSSSLAEVPLVGI
jgi:hypothetical protein